MANLGKIALIEQTKKFNGQDNVDTANKLLAQNTDEDYSILAQLGLSDHQLDAKLHSLGEYTRISGYAEEWGYCISDEVLVDIAYKYGLTLGKSKYYKFSVPITITSDIKEWSKKTNTGVGDSDSFYILAPSESFYNDDEYAASANKPKCTKKGADPMLVYEIAGSEAEGGKVFSLITEWGSDLNKLRKVKAYTTNNAKTFTTLSILTIIATITGIVYYGVNGLTTGLAGNDWVTIIMGIMTFVGMGIVIYPLLNEVRAQNIQKKDFNIYGRLRNFTKPVMQEWVRYDHEYQYKKYFGDMTTRFLIVSGVISILFFLFTIMNSSGEVSFAKELGYSNWYFLIPLGTVGLTFTVALIAKVFQNVKWD